MRDFEEYLRDSIGRTSQDTIANLERLTRMDNQLERMRIELEDAHEGLAKAEGKQLAIPGSADLAQFPFSGSLRDSTHWWMPD